MSAASPQAETPDWLPRLLFWVLLFNLLCVAYSPALRGPFLFDGIPSIVENPDLRHPGEPWRFFASHETSMQFDRRPVAGLLTLANFQFAGLDPLPYRLTNLAVHFFCALTLASCVRLVARGLRLAHAAWFPEAVAGLWAVHPLNSLPVLYIYQRMEGLMTLFFLLALAATAKAALPPARASWWRGLALAASALCVLSKEVGLGVFVAVPLLDRVLSGARETRAWLRERRFFLAGLAVVFVLLAWYSLSGVRMGELDDGAELATPWGYFKLQCHMLAQYLRLVFWPSPLVFYYFPQHTTRWEQWLPYLVALFAALATVVLWARARPGRYWVLLPVAVFGLVLAPTTSFVPIPLEPAAEFRMHLPSAMVILVVAAGAVAASRATSLPRALPTVVAVAAGTTLLAGTHLRARDFSSPVAVWSDLLQKQPFNLFAMSNLAYAYLESGDLDQAAALSRALAEAGARASDPAGIAEAERLAGLVSAGRGDHAAARLHFETALELNPSNRRPIADFAWSCLELGDAAGARDALGPPGAVQAAETPPWLLAVRGRLALAEGDRETARRFTAEARRLGVTGNRIDALTGLLTTPGLAPDHPPETR